MHDFKYYIPGVLLILMAVFIIVVPEILVVMISVFVMTLGVFVLYIGHGMRKSEIELRRMNGRYRTSVWHRYCFLNRKAYKKIR
jgi:hypothetical protein